MMSFQNDPLMRLSVVILRHVVEAVDILLSRLVGPLSKPITGIVRAIMFAPVGLEYEEEKRAPIDQRLAKLDTARVALEESLSAVNELQAESVKAQTEHAAAMRRLDYVLASKGDAEKQLAEVRAFYKRDMTTFRQLAGTPNMAVERFVSFVLGIVASIIASVMWNWQSVSAWIVALIR